MRESKGGEEGNEIKQQKGKLPEQKAIKKNKYR